MQGYGITKFLKNLSRLLQPHTGVVIDRIRQIQQMFNKFVRMD